MTGRGDDREVRLGEHVVERADLVDRAALERDPGGCPVGIVPPTQSTPARFAARPTDAPIRPVPTTARRISGGGAHQLGDMEGEVERLACVQPRVAERRIGVVELLLGEAVAPAEALGDVVAGDLEVDAARATFPPAWWTAKNPSISAMMWPKSRVFRPAAVLNVFACIGSQTQTTG